MDSKQFGARIRQARERLGMTQEELAERSDKDQRAISEYENGKRRLSAIDLPVLAKVLNVPMMYFFEGEATRHDFDLALLEEFNRLPTTEAKQSAIELLRVFSDAIATHNPAR
ncbi:MAG: helix-turn-helix transcriptional regulator [Chloroflexi bacterium]|nr:helix-turn-helix transcriptional regulator [Chloroflexota bacterium]